MFLEQQFVSFISFLNFGTSIYFEVIAAGEAWSRTCHASIVALAKVGMLGESMFACKISGMVSEAVAQAIGKQIIDLMHAAHTEQTPVTAARIGTWRDIILKDLETVAGLDLLPSKRAVDVVYRKLVVPKVPVTCLANEVELRLRAAILQRAVAQDLFPEMAAEKILGYSPSIVDKENRICADVVAQATCRQHICTKRVG